MITIIHPLVLNVESQFGGIETWIQDFLQYSKGRYCVLGVTKGVNDEQVFKVREGVELHKIASLPLTRKLVPDLFRVAFALIKNRKLITSDVMLHRLELAPLVRLLCPKARVVIFIHTNLRAQLRAGSDSLWRFVPLFYSMVERLSLFCASEVIVYSKEQKQHFITKGVTARQALAWYDDSVFQYRSEPTSPCEITWVGRFEDVKDPLLALRSLALIKHELKNPVKFIGAGSLLPEMLAEVAKLGLADQIQFLKPLSAIELSKSLSVSTVILQTSRFEGSPRILLEALACGTRVVSTIEGDPDGWAIDQKLGIRATNRGPDSVATALKTALALGRVSEASLSAIRARGASKIVQEIESWIHL